MNALTLRHENKSIVITKDFAKKSSNPNNAEYQKLADVKRVYADYTVIVRAVSKKNSKTNKITRANMKAYISKHDDDGSIMAKFEAMVNEKAGENLQRTSFFAIKKWFFEQYPDLNA